MADGPLFLAEPGRVRAGRPRAGRAPRHCAYRPCSSRLPSGPARTGDPAPPGSLGEAGVRPGGDPSTDGVPVRGGDGQAAGGFLTADAQRDYRQETHHRPRGEKCHRDYCVRLYHGVLHSVAATAGSCVRPVLIVLSLPVRPGASAGDLRAARGAWPRWACAGPGVPLFSFRNRSDQPDEFRLPRRVVPDEQVPAGLELGIDERVKRDRPVDEIRPGQAGPALKVPEIISGHGNQGHRDVPA